MTKPVIIGDAQLYLGDCLEILPGLPKVDAVITDPPYGIGAARYTRGGTQYGASLARCADYGIFEWDDSPVTDEHINLIRRAADNVAIFGGNYYQLPPARCWLVWDKVNGENEYADCELAWTNWDKAVRRIQWRWHGMLREGNEQRWHPTQKPAGVMLWAIRQCPKSDTVLDPFMGSGTTGVACAQLGRKFIGIEIEPRYFDIACRRIDDAYRQGKLFDEPRAKSTQEALL